MWTQGDLIASRLQSCWLALCLKGETRHEYRGIACHCGGQDYLFVNHSQKILRQSPWAWWLRRVGGTEHGVTSPLALLTIVGLRIAYYVCKSQYSDQCDPLDLYLAVKYQPHGVF